LKKIRVHLPLEEHHLHEYSLKNQEKTKIKRILVEKRVEKTKRKPKIGHWWRRGLNKP
jgi:hypothetical protein